MKFLVIQTAFTGDVVLATALLENIHSNFSDAEISVVVRKGNESLLLHHPFLKNIFTWDKKKNKFKNLLSLISIVRKENFDVVINLQRFASSGLLTVLSGGKEKIGFAKNPFSLLFSKRFPHTIGDGMHEIERNQKLIQHLSSSEISKPALYPNKTEFDRVLQYQKSEYVTVSPGSVWFTKTFPAYKWIELLDLYSKNKINTTIYLLGSKSEADLGNEIISKSKNKKIINLAGTLSFLESTALMKNATMNYVNDSAPMHMAGAINANVTAVYCSTVPNFGFGPLSSHSNIVETTLALDCRPCGLHGYKDCPLTHFKCAHSISIDSVYQKL